MMDKEFILKNMHESRKAQRNYSDQEVDQELIDFLIEVAVNAPSKQNEVDFNLTVITNKDMLKEHEERFTWGYHWKQTNSAMHNTQVHAPLIFVYGQTLPEDIHKDIWAADEDGPGENELFEEQFRDTQNLSIGISSGQLVLSARMMGLTTGFSQNTMHNGVNTYDWKEFLGYDRDEFYNPKLVVGVGYPDETLKWFQTKELDYVVADKNEKNLDTKPYLDICSDDIRQYPMGKVFEFGPKSAKRNGTPIPKNVKVKKFF